MKTPDEIQHNGKTLELLPKIEEATQGDWVMISGKLYPVNSEKKVESLYYYEYREFIQAAYREKKAEVYEWVTSDEFANAHIIQHPNRTLENINALLTKKYGIYEKKI